MGELLGMFLDQVGKGKQDAGTASRLKIAPDPAREGLACALDGGIDIRGRCLWHRADRLAGARIVQIDPLARQGADLTAADDHLPVADVARNGEGAQGVHIVFLTRGSGRRLKHAVRAADAAGWVREIRWSR